MRNIIIGIVISGLVIAGCAPAPTVAPTASSAPPTAAPPTVVPPTAAQPTVKPPAAASETPPALSARPTLAPATTKLARTDAWTDHVVLTIPGMDQTQIAANVPFWSKYGINMLMDVYYPPGYKFESQLPVVILVQGFTDSGGDNLAEKDFQFEVDWAKLIAASGMIAVAPQAYQEPVETLTHAMDFMNANSNQLGIDMSRIGFWGADGESWPANIMFMRSPYRDNFRAAAFLYADLGAIPSSWPSNLSLYVIKAGKGDAAANQASDKFVAAAQAGKVPVTYVTLTDSEMGFDIVQNDQTSKDAIQAVLDYLKNTLLAAG